MNLKELRVGNLVDTGDFHLPKYKGVYEVKDDWFKYACKFDPVKLNEEWLINLGFEFYEPLSHYRIVINDVWYQVKTNKEGHFIFSFINLNYDEINHMPPKIIEYVHRLQNLMFELSDIELTFNNTNENN